MPSLSIRLTVAQDERLTHEANAFGYTRSSLLKKAYFGKEYKARRVPRPDQVVLATILGQLGKIGSNVNQMAKKYNTGQLPPNMVVIKSIQAIESDINEMGERVKELING